MDSSSIVKLYINEPGSEETANSFNSADGVATSLVAYPEVRAAFARLLRERKITRRLLQRLVQDFDAGWQGFYAVAVTESIVRTAGLLAERHALTGFDAIHLASALALRDRQIDNVDLSTGDERLKSGAIAEGFVVV